MDFAKVVSTLISNGRNLREAGVRELRFGDVYVTLAPPDVAVEQDSGDPVPEDDGDPLNDPVTFGRRTSVPRLNREDD